MLGKANRAHPAFSPATKRAATNSEYPCLGEPEVEVLSRFAGDLPLSIEPFE
jgi:hypothetical protein